jgi:hypothetical protein
MQDENMTNDLERKYDIDSAFTQLLAWGWPETALTRKQVARWAHEKRAPFRKNPIDRKLYIKESDLQKIYTGDYVPPTH